MEISTSVKLMSSSSKNRSIFGIFTRLFMVVRIDDSLLKTLWTEIVRINENIVLVFLKVERILKRGGEVEKRDGNGMTALMRAVCRRQVLVVDFLLNDGAEVNTQDNWGLTPLIRASYSGEEKMVKTLLSFGADMSAETGIGETALIWAAFRGHGDVVEILLDSAADVEKPDFCTALMIAAHKKHREVVEIFQRKAANKNLFAAVQQRIT